MSKELEKALELLRAAKQFTWDLQSPADLRLRIDDFLASQQGEQCTTPAGNVCPGDGVKSCKKCSEQAEGAQGEREDVIADRNYVAGMQAGWNFAESADEAGFKRAIDSRLAGIRAALAQPSPAPELERPEVVAALRLQVAMLVTCAGNVAKERDAALARVAELVAALESAATAMWNSEANMDNEAADAEEAIGNAKSADPVAQAGQVPECFRLLLKHAHGMTTGVDWNKGTAAGHHREPLGEAVVQCQAWLAAAPQPAKGDGHE